MASPVTSAERIPYIPDMPTVAETLPGYDVTTWYGLLLPAGTPAAVRDKLQSAMTRAVNMPETRRRFEELGYVTITETPRNSPNSCMRTSTNMAKLIKQYNLKPE